MRITAFYAGLFGLLFVLLSVRALRLRRKLQITVGDAGNPEMLRAMRVHANFAEYVPLGILLIYFTEVQGAHAAFLHVVCLALFVGRLSHAYGVSQRSEKFQFRVFGMAMTLTTIVVASLYLLLGAVRP